MRLISQAVEILSSFPPPPVLQFAFSPTALPNITLDSLTGWDNGEEYTEVACSVDSIAPAAVVTWHVGNGGRSISSQTVMELRADGWVWARSSVRFPSSLYSGQNLSCSVEHRSLRAPEKRTILVEHSMFFTLSGSRTNWHSFPSLPVTSCFLFQEPF